MGKAMSRTGPYRGCWWGSWSCSVIVLITSFSDWSSFHSTHCYYYYYDMVVYLVFYFVVVVVVVVMHRILLVS